MPPKVQQRSTPSYPQHSTKILPWLTCIKFFSKPSPHEQHQQIFNLNLQLKIKFESPVNTQQKYSEGTSTYTSPKVYQAPSPNISFKNYFKSGSTSQRPRRACLFRIWETSEEPNEGHQSDPEDED